MTEVNPLETIYKGTCPRCGFTFYFMPDEDGTTQCWKCQRQDPILDASRVYFELDYRQW